MAAARPTLPARSAQYAPQEVTEIPATQARAAYPRWLVSYGAFGIPQAAAPVAFALAALGLTGSADHGAAIVMAMTLAQIVGAVPVARWGRGRPTTSYLRLLIGIRTVALVGAAVFTASGLPLWAVAAAAAIAGFVNGAAYGNLRVLLSSLVAASRLPRALGVAATFNEITFAASPVAASALGVVDPALAVGALAVLGALPLVLLPNVTAPQAPAQKTPTLALIQPRILVWLCCGLAVESAVAAVEVGAVSRAIRFSLPPGAAIVFTLSLCIASISGGVWVSIRNRPARPPMVIVLLSATAVGAVLVAGAWTLVTTVMGAVVIGFCLPPLGTHFSLVLEHEAPAGKHAEAFAMLRTANALGIVAISAVLAFAGLFIAQIVSVVFIVTALTLVIVRTTVDTDPHRAPHRMRRRRQRVTD